MNIIHGYSATGTFKQAFHIPSDEVLVFTDILSCGPLKSFTDIEPWKHFRQEFWSGVDDVFTIKDDDSELDELQRDFYENYKELANTNKIKLWIGTGLSGQLLLAFLINCLDHSGFDLAALEIFQFEKIQKTNLVVQSLGLLNPEEIKNHPKPYTLTKEDIATAKTAWQAVTSSSPEAYLQFINSKSKDMPLLRKAMKPLFYRYPKSSNGLSYWDEQLLKHTAEHGPNAARIIGYTLGHGMDGLDYVGDFYLFNRLKNMGSSQLSTPLIEANSLDLPMRETHINILPAGLNALQDKVNVIELNGIDDWVGGVHQDSSTGSVWLRNNEALFLQKL